MDFSMFNSSVPNSGKTIYDFVAGDRGIVNSAATYNGGLTGGITSGHLNAVEPMKYDIQGTSKQIYDFPNGPEVRPNLKSNIFRTSGGLTGGIVGCNVCVGTKENYIAVPSSDIGYYSVTSNPIITSGDTKTYGYIGCNSTMQSNIKSSNLQASFSDVKNINKHLNDLDYSVDILLKYGYTKQKLKEEINKLIDSKNFTI